MCSERDCQIFRGMITACDECSKFRSGRSGANPARRSDLPDFPPNH